MDRRKGGRNQRRRDHGGREKRRGLGSGRIKLKSEKGYLLVSTLFLLMFSGLFSQSMIKISGNQIIQLRQVSTTYEAKSALNMSKRLLQQQVDKNTPPNNGLIKTSIGTVVIEQEEKEEEVLFTLTLTTNSGTQYTDILSIAILEPEPDSNPIEEIEEAMEEEVDETESENKENSKPEENPQTVIENEVEDKSETDEETEQEDSELKEEEPSETENLKNTDNEQNDRS